MDLNQLLFRHQVSVARAAQGASPEARHAHRELAKGYARRIDEIQKQSGAAVQIGRNDR